MLLQHETITAGAFIYFTWFYIYFSKKICIFKQLIFVPLLSEIYPVMVKPARKVIVPKVDISSLVVLVQNSVGATEDQEMTLHNHIFQQLYITLLHSNFNIYTLYFDVIVI